VRVTAAPEAEPVLALLTELAATAPLTRAYQLLIADIDDSGKVRAHGQQLFAPGDRPGAQARLSLRRLPGDRMATTLAIFADGGTSEPMALYSAPVTAGAAFQLSALLAGPGRVQITEPEATTEPLASWQRVRAALPERVDVTTGPADLVCAVDLTGTEEMVRDRRRLVSDLLTLLAAEYPGPGSLRVAVLTCRDHEYGPDEKENVIATFGPASVSEAATWLAARPAEPPRYPWATPVEDLLDSACLLLEPSRRKGRAARVLTVTGKPPHPGRQDPYAPSDLQRLHPCPRRYDWRFSVAQLTRAAARCVTVSEVVRPDQPAPLIWQQLGPHGLHSLATATPRRLGEDLGLLVPPEQRIPIPLTDWK
jgi:hypothetical protein